MAFEINILGEIVPFAHPAEWEVINLSDVEKMLEGAKGQDITVNINSPGGDVDEGFMIYTALRKYAAENNAKVTTYAKGRCHSIATVIFLAGDERIANKFLEPFVHNAWTFAVGDAGELLRTAADLEKINKRIAEFYAEHTDLTYEEARELMDNDSYINPEEAVRIRFATKIEEVLRPVALNRILNKKSKIIMANEKSEKSFFKAMKEFFASSGASNLEVYTSASESIVFPDLEDGATPKVGDKATIDGKAAEGRYTLADGTEYVFVAGELTEINEPSDDDIDDTVEEIAALKQENEDLKAQIAAMNKRLDKSEKLQKEADARWNKLKTTVSEYVVDDEENEDKSSSNPKNLKKGLAGAASRLKGTSN